MNIWPENISALDAAWLKARALLQVLPLDPRLPGTKRSSTVIPAFYRSADEYLVRPMVQVDQKRVLTPYFSFCLRFGVSVSVHGRILLDSADELAEFRTVVNAAIDGPLTTAERNRWVAEAQRFRCERSGDPMAEVFRAVAGEESLKAVRWYTITRAALSGKWMEDTHAAVLEKLVHLGSTLQGGLV